MSKIDPKRAWSTTTVPAASAESENAGFDELLTVGEVAGLLKVSRSWVYEHTRARGMPKSEQLPYIKIGKYVRFDRSALTAFLRRKCRGAQ